ncbi:wybutosine biosynthesis protein Tyw3 [Schizosaccharomyces japonicus yFS275]|uniref:tRNA wybutosine-synthesizing protein 3 n=1 Tax=Schizosaccharomyces japonicus (strain yFS275 / FY16936) TaxID=402676 RepID=B6K776_SCHJY|nr:wybutosine biosynthesis protein Tyw3 [Schizosaccharomyces japonicus yFS275]EEB09380.1 wybutosine biosynthesis protein Tyw3 [Schizosaccharomyces japonicus yFS275]
MAAVQFDASGSVNGDPFDEAKAKILKQLESNVPDASPKGHPDSPIFPLLKVVNSHPDWVTTSSCSGRISVYVQGAKTRKGGGYWLFVSHEAQQELPEQLESANVHYDDENSLEEGEREGAQHGVSRDVQFAFEPMILHVQTRTMESAQMLHRVAASCGFRETGIQGSDSKHIVAIRTSLRIDVPLGRAFAPSASNGEQAATGENVYASVVSADNGLF